MLFLLLFLMRHSYGGRPLAVSEFRVWSRLGHPHLDPSPRSVSDPISTSTASSPSLASVPTFMVPVPGAASCLANGWKLSESEDKEYSRSQGRCPSGPDSGAEATNSSRPSDSSSSDDPDSNSGDGWDGVRARAARVVSRVSAPPSMPRDLTRGLVVEDRVPRDLRVPKVKNGPPAAPTKKGARPGGGGNASERPKRAHGTPRR